MLLEETLCFFRKMLSKSVRFHCYKLDESIDIVISAHEWYSRVYDLILKARVICDITDM